MSTPLASSLFAWLLTYLIHSTALLGLAWLVTRRGRLEPAASDLLWKVALLASLVTGTIQSRLALSTPAAVTLPVAALPQAAPLNQPADANSTVRTDRIVASDGGMAEHAGRSEGVTRGIPES